MMYFRIYTNRFEPSLYRGDVVTCEKVDSVQESDYYVLASQKGCRIEHLKAGDVVKDESIYLVTEITRGIRCD